MMNKMEKENEANRKTKNQVAEEIWVKQKSLSIFCNMCVYKLYRMHVSASIKNVHPSIIVRIRHIEGTDIFFASTM